MEQRLSAVDRDRDGQREAADERLAGERSGHAARRRHCVGGADKAAHHPEHAGVALEDEWSDDLHAGRVVLNAPANHHLIRGIEMPAGFDPPSRVDRDATRASHSGAAEVACCAPTGESHCWPDGHEAGAVASDPTRPPRCATATTVTTSAALRTGYTSDPPGGQVAPRQDAAKFDNLLSQRKIVGWHAACFGEGPEHSHVTHIVGNTPAPRYPPRAAHQGETSCDATLPGCLSSR